MLFFHSIIENAAEWIDSLPVVAGLLLTVAELRHVQKAQRVSNQLTIIEHHRDIWSRLFENPELARILEPKADLHTRPITNQEGLFVTFLILHLKGVIRAKEAQMFIPAKNLKRDIEWLFSLPIPQEVWKRSKAFQDPELVRFIDDALNGNPQ